MHKILYNQYHVLTMDRGLGCHGCENCQNANKKKKKPRQPTGDELRQTMEQAMAQWNDQDGKERTLLEVNSDHIIYTEAGKTLKRSFSFNQYGVLEFGMDSEVSNYNQFLKEVATRAVQHLINQVERSYDMKKEENILLPSGIVTNASDNEADQKEIQALRDEADQKGILLPAHFNVIGTKKAEQQKDKNLLMPIGFEGR